LKKIDSSAIRKKVDFIDLGKRSYRCEMFFANDKYIQFNAKSK